MFLHLLELERSLEYDAMGHDPASANLFAEHNFPISYKKSPPVVKTFFGSSTKNSVLQCLENDSAQGYQNREL